MGGSKLHENMSAERVPFARQVSSPRFELLQEARAVAEDALVPPLARLASSNFASSAKVAEVYVGNDKVATAVAASEPGVEIVKPVQTPPWFVFVVSSTIQFCINGFLAPASRVLNCYTVQPELIRRGSIRKPWNGLLETFFALGSMEGAWAMARGSFYGSLGYLTYEAVNSALCKAFGVSRKVAGAQSLKEFAATVCVDATALAAAYSFFSVRVVLSTDFASDARARLFKNGPDVLRKLGFASLYRGFGYALAASLLRDVAIVLRKRSRTRAGLVVGWALVLGVCPFFEMAVARAAVGGLQGMGPLQVARSVVKGPWSAVTLVARI